MYITICAARVKGKESGNGHGEGNHPVERREGQDCNIAFYLHGESFRNFFLYFNYLTGKTVRANYVRICRSACACTRPTYKIYFFAKSSAKWF